MKYFYSETGTDMRFAAVYRSVLMPITFIFGVFCLGSGWAFEKSATDPVDVTAVYLLAVYGGMCIIKSCLVFLKLPQRTPLSWYLVMITAPLGIILDLILALALPLPFLPLAAFRIWVMVYFAKRKPLFIYMEQIFICPDCENVARLDPVFTNMTCPSCGGTFIPTEIDSKRWDGMTEYAREQTVRDVIRRAPHKTPAEKTEKTAPED